MFGMANIRSERLESYFCNFLDSPPSNPRFTKPIIPAHLRRPAEAALALQHALEGPRCRGNPVQEEGCCCSSSAAAGGSPPPPCPPLLPLKSRGAHVPPCRARRLEGNGCGVWRRRRARPRRRHPSPSTRHADPPPLLSEMRFW